MKQETRVSFQETITREYVIWTDHLASTRTAQSNGARWLPGAIVSLTVLPSIPSVQGTVENIRIRPNTEGWLACGCEAEYESHA